MRTASCTYECLMLGKDKCLQNEFTVKMGEWPVDGAILSLVRLRNAAVNAYVAGGRATASLQHN